MILQELSLSEIFPKVSEIAIVIGNGTSVKKYKDEFKSLKKQAPIVFGVNRIFFPAYEDFFPIDYYLALDRTCWHNHSKDLQVLKCLRYFVYVRYNQVAQVNNLVQFELSKNPMDFSTDSKLSMGHNHTSIAPCVQLAVMQGAKTIHFFGVDCKPDGGIIHAHDTIQNHRTEKVWQVMSKGVRNILENLRRLGISYQIHSDLFDLEAKEWQIAKGPTIQEERLLKAL